MIHFPLSLNYLKYINLAGPLLKLFCLFIFFNNSKTDRIDKMNTLKKVLVANRGEIAIRVFRALTELNLKTVAIYSREDSGSHHRYKADESYLVGAEKKPIDAYLDIEGIISIAKNCGADAIHPGYGFLSENLEFAQRCEQEGIVFIGPESRHLDMFGDND